MANGDLWYVVSFESRVMWRGCSRSVLLAGISETKCAVWELLARYGVAFIGKRMNFHKEDGGIA